MIITLKFSEVRDLENVGSSVINREVFIRDEDIQSWEITEVTIPPAEDREAQTQKIVSLIMRDKKLGYDVVDVPRLVKKGNDLVTEYDKKVIEISNHIYYTFEGEEADKVLEQLNRIPKD